MKNTARSTLKPRRGVFLSAVLAIGVMAAAWPAQAVFFPQSKHVAYTGTLWVINGGTFPTTTTGITGTFNDFSFNQITRGSVTAANLGPGGVCGAEGCDTILLNVASSYGNGGLGCNVNNFSADELQTLVDFVNNGGKLIIYDSECSTQDYSWLPYPFTTANPGAFGAHGTLTIVEENVLSTTDNTDTYYIDDVLLEDYTDAIGDMNVMTTYNPNWYLDMSGTNYLNVTGPVHTYARFGNGLIIYNGFDVDYLSSSTIPNPTSGAGNLAKTWLQELQASFNPTPPDDLPSGSAVIGITLSPASAVNDLGLGQDEHTVTAKLTDLLNDPQPGVEVAFEVLAGGPNAGAAGTCLANADCTTDANGEVNFTYASNGATGMDTIEACFNNALGQELCQTATKEWIETAEPCDLDLNGLVDRYDIAMILAARGTAAARGDPLDIDGDGIISINDARVCTLQCSNPRCLP